MNSRQRRTARRRDLAGFRRRFLASQADMLSALAAYEVWKKNSPLALLLQGSSGLSGLDGCVPAPDFNTVGDVKLDADVAGEGPVPSGDPS